jgi:hypothetical protein
MPRWCVVDSSYLRTVALDTFLAADPSNRALLTEEAVMEAHKGDSLATLNSSLEVVSRHRGQVSILRGSAEVSAAQAIATLSREDLIDTGATATFYEFCDVLPQALAGDDRLASGILEHAASIKAHLAAAQDQSASLAESISLLIEELPPSLVKELRANKPVAREHAAPVATHIIALAHEFYRRHPQPPPVPRTLAQLRETIIFRKALSSYLLVLDWVAKGGFHGAKPPTFANDLLDMMQVGYATYFDGFLSTDRKASQIYRETLFFLDSVFPRNDGA